MSVNVVDYIVATNEDWRDTLDLTSGDADTPVDLTGSIFIAHLRPAPDTLYTTIEASTLNGRIVIADAKTGQISWNINTDEMRLIAPGVYFYDIVWISAENAVDNFVAGTVTVIRGITRP